MAMTESQVEALARRVTDLEEQAAEKDEQIDELQATVETLDKEKQVLEALADGLEKKADSNAGRISELQSRELEKGAHLKQENIHGLKPRLDVAEDRLERFEGDDGGTWFRLPGTADPLERSGSSKLAQGDSLPIQQSARMDEDTLPMVDSVPVRLAVKAWQERADGGLWNTGCGPVRQYTDASDLQVWIRREGDDISESYAKKLVSRTFDALLDLTNNQLRIERRDHRKDGLSYTERRCIVPTKAEIPGEKGGSQE